MLFSRQGTPRDRACYIINQLAGAVEEGGKLPYPLFHQFCNEDTGLLNAAYINSEIRGLVSQKFYNNYALEVLGASKLTHDDRADYSECTKDEFMSVYEFGKYCSVTSFTANVWQQTERLATKERIFGFIQEATNNG